MKAIRETVHVANFANGISKDLLQRRLLAGGALAAATSGEMMASMNGDSRQYSPETSGDDDDDDDVTLDSLEIRDSVSDDDDGDDVGVVVDDAAAPPTDRSGILKESTENAISLFREFQFSDPLMRLNEYYQRKGIVDGVAKCFQDEPVAPADKKHKGPPVWRCSFRCPLTGLESHSGIPLPLLVSEHDQSTDELEEHTTNFFGNFRVIDGIVHFTSKKAAKKSAALSMLEALEETTLEGARTVLIRSSADASIYLYESDQQGMEANIDTQKTRFPSWVHELYNAGISDLRISYREPLVQDPSWWRLDHQTQVCCRISITKPIKLSVLGMPHPSKFHARQSAVSLLVAEMQRQCPPSTSTSINDENIISAMKKKQKIYSRDVQVAKYIFPLAPWATAPVQVDSNNGRLVAYLYELELSATDGTPFVVERMKLEPHATTRIGVLFATDIHPPLQDGNNGFGKTSCFRTTFPDVRKDGSEEIYVVTIGKRTVVQLDNSDAAATKLQWIKHFDRISARWKTYGFLPKNGPRKQKKMQPLNQDRDGLMDRTYLFVPLKREQQSLDCNGEAKEAALSIDWKLLEAVFRGKPEPYMVPAMDARHIPLVAGVLDTNDLVLVHVLLALVIFAPYIYGQGKVLFCSVSRHLDWSTFQDTLCHSEAVVTPPHITQMDLWVGSIFVLLAVIVYNLPPKKRVSLAILRNRFLVQDNNYKTTYLLSDQEEGRLTARSKMITNNKQETELSQGYIERNKRMFQLDVQKASYAEYYLKRYGKRIQNPGELLLAVHSIKKHAHHVPFGYAADESCADTIHLVPEFVRCMPMPRDALYVIGFAHKFMPAVERAINLAWFSLMLRAAGATATNESNSHGPHIATNRILRQQVQTEFRMKSLPTLLHEATSLHPFISYQRLEFLGDAVLNYLLALTAVSRNNNLLWDCSDLSQMVSNAGKNTTLFSAALRIGVKSMFQTMLRPWMSAYGHGRGPPSKKPTPKEVFEASFYGYDTTSAPVYELGDFTLSDAVESLIGAAYLHGMGNDKDATGDGMIIAMLEALRLPLPDNNEALRKRWFTPPSACWKNGYSFSCDWRMKLDEIRSTFQSNPQVLKSLDTGCQALVELLSRFSSLTTSDLVDVLLEEDRSRILLLAALFDDSLEDDLLSDYDDESMSVENDSLDSSSVALRRSSSPAASRASILEGLYQVALLRDSLSHVGGHALHLMITEEVFSRFPDATAGDLHLLRSCAAADDSIAYIMMKFGFQNVVYDNKASSLSRLEGHILQSDQIGQEIWKKHGGWIMEGGAEEYKKRSLALCSLYKKTQPSSNPRYCGLAGGRLYGTSKKLQESIVGDFVFSARAMIGGLVLAMGTEGMWSCIGPLFDEVLVLSPDELRTTYGSVSPLCRSCSPGKKAGNKKVLRYGVLE